MNTMKYALAGAALLVLGATTANAVVPADGRETTNQTRCLIQGDGLNIRNKPSLYGNKVAALEDILADAQISAAECCFIGDDLADISVMRRVGLAVAVADASPDAKAVAHHVTSLAGGAGAVRQVVELILKAQDRWEQLWTEVVD